MPSFTIGITINRPVEVVVQALLNPQNFPYWQTDLERFEVLAGKPGEVGSIGRLHYRQRGRPYTMEDKLIICEPNKRFVSQVTSPALTATVETILISSNSTTEMILTWSGKGSIVLMRVMLPLLKRKMIKQSMRELETFKRLVESQGSNFRGPPENGA